MNVEFRTRICKAIAMFDARRLCPIFFTVAPIGIQCMYYKRHMILLYVFMQLP